MLCGLLSAENNPGAWGAVFNENGSQRLRERFSGATRTVLVHFGFFRLFFPLQASRCSQALVGSFQQPFHPPKPLSVFLCSICRCLTLPAAVCSPLNRPFSPTNAAPPLSVVVSHFLLRFALLSFSCCFPISLLIKTVIFFVFFLDFNSLIISIVSIEINFKILGLNRQILWKLSSLFVPL